MTALDLIFHIILISAVTVGGHIAIGKLLEELYKDPEWIYIDAKPWQKHLIKPMFYCPTCMASVWGTTLHFYFGGTLHDWIPVCFALAFTNRTLNRVSNNL